MQNFIFAKKFFFRKFWLSSHLNILIFFVLDKFYWTMNIFLFELWNDSTKTIRLLTLDFYAVIVDSGFALINYHRIEISSS